MKPNDTVEAIPTKITRMSIATNNKGGLVAVLQLINIKDDKEMLAAIEPDHIEEILETLTYINKKIKTLKPNNLGESLSWN